MQLDDLRYLWSIVGGNRRLLVRLHTQFYIETQFVNGLVILQRQQVDHELRFRRREILVVGNHVLAQRYQNVIVRELLRFGRAAVATILLKDIAAYHRRGDGCVVLLWRATEHFARGFAGLLLLNLLHVY